MPFSSRLRSTSLTDDRIKVRDFMFRGLMFEAEASYFRNAGIDVGGDRRLAEDTLLGEAMAPFGVTLRNQALEMARLYAVLHCFENEVRELIRERLEEKDGVDWWAKVPDKIRRFADSRRETAEKDSWLEGERYGPLGFVEFGHLADIITNRWDVFGDLIPTQHWLKQRMEELEKARNFIAHNRALLANEFERVYMYVRDWNRVVGL